MSKLHEVLAVESGLKATANKVINEAKDTFKTKHSLFVGQNRRYEKVLEDSIDFADEDIPLTSTVKEKLDYIKEHIIRSLDATAQKEYTNTTAKSDLIVDGQTLLKDVPATMLLTLESNLENLRSVLEVIPTLLPGRNWKKDETQVNVFLSDEQETLKTEKVVQPLLLSPATDKHPAQVDKITLDKVVGKWHTKVYSGMITSLEKSKLIGNLDNLIHEVKKARMRANSEEVNNVEIGKVLVDFILK